MRLTAIHLQSFANRRIIDCQSCQRIRSESVSVQTVAFDSRGGEGSNASGRYAAVSGGSNNRAIGTSASVSAGLGKHGHQRLGRGERRRRQ